MQKIYLVFLLIFLTACAQEPAEEKTLEETYSPRNDLEGSEILHNEFSFEGPGGCKNEDECGSFCFSNSEICMEYCKNHPEEVMCSFFSESFEESYDEEQGRPQRGFFPDFSSLPECLDQKFTVSPVELEKLSYIIPLGNLNPPEHSTPTMHMYFHFAGSGMRIPIFAPGDITLQSIQRTQYLEKGKEDYGLRFALCNDVRGYFLHIKELSPELKALIKQEDCKGHEDSDGKYEWCQTELDYEIKAGTLLGYGGDASQQNFDFGTYDLRKPLQPANPSRYESEQSLHVVCPLDLFEETIKSELYQKVNRKGEPRCGEVMQDIPGTLKGNWFYGDKKAEEPQGWAESLAFVADNFDASQQAISIGGVFSNPEVIRFHPISEGLVNRDFSQVMPDGKVYCYEGDSGWIIVQLVSEDELKIEKYGSSCSGQFSFRSPTTYKR